MNYVHMYYVHMYYVHMYYELCTMCYVLCIM